MISCSKIFRSPVIVLLPSSKPSFRSTSSCLVATAPLRLVRQASSSSRRPAPPKIKSVPQPEALGKISEGSLKFESLSDDPKNPQNILSTAVKTFENAVQKVREIQEKKVPGSQKYFPVIAQIYEQIRSTGMMKAGFVSEACKKEGIEEDVFARVRRRMALVYRAFLRFPSWVIAGTNVKDQIRFTLLPSPRLQQAVYLPMFTTEANHKAYVAYLQKTQKETNSQKFDPNTIRMSGYEIVASLPELISNCKFDCCAIDTLPEHKSSLQINASHVPLLADLGLGSQMEDVFQRGEWTDADLMQYPMYLLRRDGNVMVLSAENEGEGPASAREFVLTFTTLDWALQYLEQHPQKNKIEIIRVVWSGVLQSVLSTPQIRGGVAVNYIGQLDPEVVDADFFGALLHKDELMQSDIANVKQK